VMHSSSCFVQIDVQRLSVLNSFVYVQRAVASFENLEYGERGDE
jgi:hypothetical protein